MADDNSMGLCLTTYFWIACIVLILKSVLGLNGAMLDAAFFLISWGAMLLIFNAVMAERCGTAPFGDVLAAVTVPWFLMIGAVLLLIRVNPGWIQPFSNTFGYMICMIPGINSGPKLTAVLKKETPMYKLILEDPSLMLNQFSTTRFDEQISKMTEGGVVMREYTVKDELGVESTVYNTAAIEELRKIVRIKDSVAEFVWHFLVGCVAITTAYNSMMNNVCQKKTLTAVPVAGTDAGSSAAAANAPANDPTNDT
jgi:hypothetical protein